MPVVFRIGAFTFFFYSNEGDPREPLHIHVRSSGAEAKLWLDPTIGIANSRGFNAERALCYHPSRHRQPRDHLEEDISIAGLLAGRGDMTCKRPAA